MSLQSCISGMLLLTTWNRMPVLPKALHFYVSWLMSFGMVSSLEPLFLGFRPVVQSCIAQAVRNQRKDLEGLRISSPIICCFLSCFSSSCWVLCWKDYDIRNIIKGLSVITDSYFLFLRASEILLFSNLQLFYWHFLEEA